MRSWLAQKLIARSMAKIREGDYEATAQMDADDVVLRFPGNSSWSGEIRGKEAHAAWLARFARVGLQIYLDELVAQGLPWRMTVVLRGHINLHSPEGLLVYDNRYVMWITLRGTRVAAYEVYEDTQKSAALDEYLAHHDPA